MAEEYASRGNGRRRTVLDLAPLERDCMQALWPLGEGTVHEIREQLAAVRPRAYTTIMTIMDRLAQKGVVKRTKVGRAYVYRPNFSAEEARAHAVEQLVDHFFEGSREALREHVSGEPGTVTPAARAPVAAPALRPARTRTRRAPEPEAPEPETLEPYRPRLDDTLL
jgi:predicted transcriptional regulator